MTLIEYLDVASRWSGILIPVMLLTGTVLGVYQLRVSAKARRLQALASIYQQLRPQEVVENEQVLLHDPQPAIRAEELTQNDARKIDAVIYSYQRLGYLLHQGLVTEQELLPMVGWESILLWEKLKNYIRNEVRQDVPHARAHFEYLASKSNDYIRNNPQLVIPKIIGFNADIDELRDIIVGGDDEREPK
jgi:hypothetical protein